MTAAVKGGPQTSSTDITQELVRNAGSEALQVQTKRIRIYLFRTFWGDRWAPWSIDSPRTVVGAQWGLCLGSFPSLPRPNNNLGSASMYIRGNPATGQRKELQTWETPATSSMTLSMSVSIFYRWPNWITVFNSAVLRIKRDDMGGSSQHNA